MTRPKQLAREAGCKHENADHMMPGEVLIRADGEDFHEVKSEQLRCLDCAGFLSLGRSRDRIPRCERRLAEKLGYIHVLWEPGLSRDEMIDLAVDDCAEMP